MTRSETGPTGTAEPAGPAGAHSLRRFDPVERVLHWTNATLFTTLLLTGFTLYGAPLTGWIGNRDVVETVHLWCGLALPVPILLGVFTSRELRRDLRRIARWTADDRRWWSRRARPGVQLGKFNPGQKTNATFVGASIVVLLGTGSLMNWPDAFADSWREGATFVHDSFAFALVAVIVGHIWFALRDPVALRSMIRGAVPAEWAAAHAPRWLAEVTGTAASGPARSGTPEGPGR